MVFFAETNPNQFLEATDSKVRESLRDVHPDLWPLPPFQINKTTPANELVAVGCLAAPTLELTQFTHEPMVFSADGRFQYDKPSLNTILTALNRPKDRWFRRGYDQENPEEIHRMESLLFTPKTSEIREAFLAVFKSLQSRPEAKKLIGQYKSARIKRMNIGIEESGYASRKRENRSFTFHALHDVIGAYAPILRGNRNDLSFWLPDQKIKDFIPPQIFKNYIQKARAISPLFGEQLERILHRDLASAETLLDEYMKKRKELEKEEPKWKDPADEIAPHAWHAGIISNGYSFSKEYDVRHSQLHWSAAIIDYFTNLHDLYGKLSAKKISTCIPSIGNTIKATELMHIPRSLEALNTPERKPEPVTISLTAEKSVIFIGSNNSGKSFTMEMIVANAMESMQGRKTFATSFESPEFHAIIAIPAELPQETGKSTYTGQLARLVHAINEISAIQKVKPDANVLLIADELFAGTDEHDSAALYKATIEWMNAHHVTLVGATNNELVFDPEIAEFISMVNRKPVIILHSEDIIAKRQGIPILEKAGLPTEIISRAAELADTEISSTGEHVNISHFSELRNAITMGIVEQHGEVVTLGRNFLLWDTEYGRPPLFRASDILKRVFGSPSNDPIKIQYKQWESELTSTDMEYATNYLYGIAGALSNCMDIPNRLKPDRDISESDLYIRFSGIVEQAQESLSRIKTLKKIHSNLPDTMKKQVEELVALTMNMLEAISAIPTTDTSSSTLQHALASAISPVQSITKEQLSNIDAINCFFHLQRVFTTHNFSIVTKNTDQSIVATDVYHTGLRHQELTNRLPVPVTKNSLTIRPDSPAMLLGANASGKSTLAESLQIAMYFAIHFGHAPAASFSLPDSIIDSIGLVDYLRDPGRPTDRGKWYSRQTQIASVIKKAETGGYVIILDEPGEGTNGFEGRATLIATAEYLTLKGNIVIFTTHQHKAVDTLEQSIGIQAFASGLDGKGRYSFSPGKASSLGLEMALEEGLPQDIVNRARELKDVITTHR